MTNDARQALVELWRVCESHTAGKKPSVRMVARWARELGHRFREDEARRLLEKFRDATGTQTREQSDSSGRKNHAPGTQLDANHENLGRSRDATSRAHDKGITDHKDPEEGYTLFGAGDTARTVKQRTKTRDLAVYAAADAIWSELHPQLRVPIAKSGWRGKNIDATEKLVAALGSSDAVVQAWRDSSALHGEATVTLARVVDDVLFGRIGPEARPPAKEKTALARGFQEPQNFQPRVFERE